MSQATNQPVASNSLITDKLAALRGRLFSVAAGGGVARLVIALLALLGAGMYLDWKIELSKEGRILLLLLDLGIALYILNKYLYQPHVNRPDDDEAALYIEHARPEFQSRLITATQLTRPGAIPPGASPELVRELVKRTEQQSRPVDFAAEVPTLTLRKLAAAAIIFAIIWGVVFNKGGQDARDLLSRAFLSDVPVPRDTHIASVTHLEIIPRGEAILITAKVDEKSDVFPDEGTLILDYGRGSDHRMKVYRAKDVWDDIKKKHLDKYDENEDGELDNTELGRIKDKDSTAIIAAGFAEVLLDGKPEGDLDKEFRFYVSAARARRNFDFDVRLNDGRKSGEVEVVARPMVQALDCLQTMPDYLVNLQPEDKVRKREKDNLRLLEDSGLKIVIKTNKDNVSGKLAFTDGDATRNFELKSTGKDRELAAEIKLDRRSITGFRIHLEDEHGFNNVSNVEYAITVLADTPPFVEITGRERREETVTSRANMPVAFRARDNYALKSLSLNWEMEHGTNTLKGSIPIDTPNLGAAIDDQTTLSIVEHIGKQNEGVPLIGKRIAFWIEATDYVEKNPPSRSQPPFIAVVVTDDEKSNELLLRTGDSIGRIGDTTNNQEQLNERLREILARRFQGIPDPPQPPTNAPPQQPNPPKR
ncbi:MAG: hypothetical protein VX705_00465 [Verrucomicrobiota bacterium]|nr:hypothetical protein [Verrucomicrobiota bacterium]